jgi:hypothetical protein
MFSSSLYRPPRIVPGGGFFHPDDRDVVVSRIPGRLMDSIEIRKESSQFRRQLRMVEHQPITIGFVASFDGFQIRGNDRIQRIGFRAVR